MSKKKSEQSNWVFDWNEWKELLCFDYPKNKSGYEKQKWLEVQSKKVVKK